MKLSIMRAAKTMVMSALILTTSAALADDISFNYQGRVKVHGQQFTGTGLFKFAILNTSATAVLWSNDGTVGVGGGNGELPTPVNALALSTADGVFSVAIGDSNVSGMASLDSAVMVSDTPLRLRVWFSDGNNGFEQLNPDQKLSDLTLNKLQTGLTDYIIYVNGSTGNDANNGLTPATAKKTVSAAVDALPDKIRCNITVSIAPGIYREMVLPNGISVQYGKTLTFKGDTSWQPSDVGSPTVVIDGADTGSTPVRDYGFYARQCSDIKIEGITFQNTKINGIKVQDGHYTISRCLAQDNPKSSIRESGCGFAAGPQAYAFFNECRADENGDTGFAIHSSSRGTLTTCTATNNTCGVFAVANSIVQFAWYNKFSNNVIGLQGNTFASLGVHNAGTNLSDRTHIINNGTGVLVNWHSHFTPLNAIITGNSKMYDRFYGTIIGVDPQ